jgi:hypothetical protein
MSQLPDELERLGAALRMEPATAATADSIDSNLGRFRNQWTTKLQVRGDALSLPVPRNQAIHPTGCELHAAYLDFQFEWREGEPMPWRAEYQVRVEGLLDAGGALFELQDHWRLDTDMYAPCRRPTEESSSNPSKEPHPLFHFQRGGHAQDAFAAAGFLPGAPCTIEGIWKGLMQSPGPRVPMLPLDPVLAIDFCLSQNDGLIWRRLRNLPEYLSVIQEAQARLWLPFFERLQDPTFRRSWLGNSLLI